MSRSILVDNSVLSHAEFASPITVDVPRFGNQLILMQAKPARGEWLRNHIEALPTIALLARQNVVKLYSYFELDIEHMRGRSFPGNVAGNAFGRLPFSRINSPIERSLFEQTELAEFASKKSQTNFCEWLLKVGPDLLKKPKLIERLNEAQLKLSTAPLYSSITPSDFRFRSSASRFVQERKS